MKTCRFCPTELTVDVRTYSCFPDACANCIDERMADVAIDRELQLRAGLRSVHRVTLSSEQIADVEERERQKSIASDPLWQPVTRGDFLHILEFLGYTELGRELEQEWTRRPLPEGMGG